MPPGGRPSLTRLVIGALLPILLLTTCTSDTPLGVTRSVQSRFDATGLFQVGDEFGIPVDRVDLELRRVSDNTVAFSRTLTGAEYAASGANLVITLTLDLDASPEDFSFLATVFSGGVEYYRASGTITAYANQSVQTQPLTPIYTGPGANADLLTIPATTALGVGQTATLNAVVSQGGTPLTGVPVAYSSSNPTQINPVRIGLNQADVTAPAAGSGSVTITAKTPNGLTTSGTLSWSPVATSIVMVSGNGQTIPSGTTAAPMVVEVRDGAGQPFAGFPVAFSVFAGPTGTSVAPLNVVTDAQGRAQTTMTAGGSAGAISIYATATGLTGSPVVFSATATAVTGPPATVTANSVLSQTATVSTAVGSPPSVVVRDAAGTALPGINVVFAVATGGGSLVGPATVTTGAGGIATVGGWIVGAAAGSNTVTATVSGLAPVTFTATGVVGAPATLTPNSVVTQSAIVNTAVAAPPSVLVRDAGGSALAGVNVVFAVATGGGSLTGPATVATNASGVATVGGWTLGQTAGPNTMSATVTGVTPAVFTATGTAGAATSVAIISGTPQTGPAGSVLPLPLVVEPRDAFGNPVPGVTVTWATPNGGSLAPASGPTDAAGRAQTTWTLGTLATTQTATATVGTLPPATFTATVGLPQITLGFVGVPGVGIGLTATVGVTLAQAAPAGGTTVNLSSGDVSVFTVTPASVTIPQGQTTATATVNGIAAGSNLLTASASGYVNGTLTVAVQNRNISVPVTLNVPYGQTASLPIQLPAPAPAGGVTFAITSSAPGNVGVATPTVTIAAGGQTANATLNGVLPGPATITVANAAYLDGVTNATTTASLNIVQTSAALNGSFGTQITINFESNGVPAAAPAPGISVSLTAADPTCVAVTSPVTIPTGLVSTTATLTYGGTAILPCNTQVTAQATNLQSDNLTASVSPVPTISVGPVTVGSGLQTNTSFTLGASNHGGVTVTLASSDPAILLSPNATTAGTSSIQIPVANGTQSVGFYVQGLEGRVTDTVAATVTVSAPGFSDGTALMPAVPAMIDLQGLPTTTTTLSPSNFLYARLGIGTAANLNQVQNLRAGGPGPLTATFSTPANGIGELLRLGGLSGVSQTAQIVPGVYYTPTDTTSGGVAFHSLLSGTTTVSVSVPGALQTAQATRSITSSQPSISVGAVTVGSGLQTNTSFTLGAPNHGNINVDLISSNGALLLSPNATTPGTDSIRIPVADGVQSVSFYVQGLEGQTGQVTPTVTVKAPGFSDGTATGTVVQGALDLQGLPTSTTPLTPSNFVYARVGIPLGGNSGLQAVQNLRAGAPGPLTATFTTLANGVGELLKSGSAPGVSQTAQVALGIYYTPTDTTSGGVAFHPLGTGATTVSASIPGFIATDQAVRAITSATPTISLGAVTVGSGLQTNTSFTLGASAHGGVTVNLSSSDPAILLAPDATTPGTQTLQVPVANGIQSVGFYVQGLEGRTTGLTGSITAQVSGFVDGTTVASVVPAAIDLQGVPATMASGAPDASIYARVGVPTAGNASLQSVQNVRPGIAGGGLTINFITSNVNAASLIQGTQPDGPTQTLQIPVGVYYTATSIGSGGVGLRRVSAGSSSISVQSTNVVSTGDAVRPVAVQ